MKCPVCDETMREIRRQEVDIDICPGCKGIWLDRGELEKLLELNAASVAGPGPGLPPLADARPGDYRAAPPADRAQHDRFRGHDDADDERYDRDGERHRDDRQGNQRKRRGSWLADLLEGFGGD